MKKLYDIFSKHPNICTDTRKITPGCLFFALHGSNFDANEFASEALDKGAAYVIVSDVSLSGDRYIIVENTLQTLQNLANFHRRHFDKPLIAITGSNGKTTTKELVTTILSGKYKVHATVGNFNNHIGVPLTILSMPSDVDISVIEMGANHIGEIKLLCEIAMPTHGLITNIGRAHLEGFGSPEGVRKAKGELFDYLKATNGYAFVNADDTSTNDLGRHLIEKTTYGLIKEENPNVLFDYTINHDGGFSIRDDKGNIEIHSTMFGHYNAINMVAAYVIGHHFNVDEKIMIQLLSEFIPGANRSEMISYSDCIVIKDAYNANPSSMELALKSFSERFPQGMVILGSMKELGSDSLSCHSSIINLVEDLNIRKAFLVGDEFSDALLKYNTKDQGRFSVFENVTALKAIWDWNSVTGQAILLKGSRSMRLEELLENKS